MGYPQDTNDTLRQARVALSQVRAALDGAYIDMSKLLDAADAKPLADAFEALDGALSTGAPLPDAWMTSQVRLDRETHRAIAIGRALAQGETWDLYRALFSAVAAWATWRAGQSDFPKGCSQEELALMALVNRAVPT